VDHEERIQPSLPGVPVGGVPRQAIAYLQAVRNYYQPDVAREPRNADIAAAHTPRLEPRTWDRRKADLRSGKLGNRDWIEVWPPPRDWHPSWEPLIDHEPVAPSPEDANGTMHLVYDETYDRDGNLLHRRLIRHLSRFSGLAAATAFMLDAMDGRLDGVIHAGCFAHYLLLFALGPLANGLKLA